MIEQITNYLTMENIIFFIVASIIFTILSKISKILFYIALAGFIYYFWIATPEVKNKIDLCVKTTIDKKEVAPICKRIYK